MSPFKVDMLHNISSIINHNQKIHKQLDSSVTKRSNKIKLMQKNCSIQQSTLQHHLRYKKWESQYHYPYDTTKTIKLIKFDWADDDDVIIWISCWLYLIIASKTSTCAELKRKNLFMIVRLSVDVIWLYLKLIKWLFFAQL